MTSLRLSTKLLAFSLFFFLASTNAQNITKEPSQAKDSTNKLKIEPMSMELLLSEAKTATLWLDPALAAGDQPLSVRFTCEDSDSGHDFDPNSTESGCSILQLERNRYDFTLGPANGSKVEITVIASGSEPGKQQLVGHVLGQRALKDGKNITVDATKAYISVNVGRSSAILIVSAIVGWIYFAAWSISFYPQIWENFKRRSVVGLNFDYVALNITGFLSYSAYNIALKYVPKVEAEFFHRHPRSQNPIELNDVVFGIHAAFATLVVIVQCFIYERGTQTVSWFSRIFLAVVWSAYIVIAIVIQFSDVISLLTFVYVFSYVKLAITLIKYIPQGYFNYQRKSTVGWSIGNIFLDFTGGLLSMFQMFLLAYNYNDWPTIMNNFTKFGLGLISILFDVFFLVQHYVLYRHSGADHSSQSTLISGGGEFPHEHRTSLSKEEEEKLAVAGERASVPTLVHHINYGATDAINTNMDILQQSSGSPPATSKSPRWTQSPHSHVIH